MATADATDEAVALSDEAATRSPHDDVLLYLRVMVLQWTGRTDAAVIAAHELGRLDWGLGRYQAGVVLIGCGRAREAVPYLKDPKVGEGAPMYREMANLWIQALEGPPRQAPQLSTELADWMNNSDDRAAWVADLYAHGNDRDQAHHWMGIAIDRGSPTIAGGPSGTRSWSGTAKTPSFGRWSPRPARSGCPSRSRPRGRCRGPRAIDDVS